MKYEHLLETINSGFDITWDTKNENSWYGHFYADDIKYIISISKEESYSSNDDLGDWFEITFGLESDGFSGTKAVGSHGNEFKIFSTVIKGFVDGIKHLQPDNILFSGYKGNRSRIPLYNRMVSKMSDVISDLGYETTTVPSNKYIDMNDDTEFKTYAFTKKYNDNDYELNLPN